MENYTITKGQVLEIHSRTSVHNQEQLKEWFPYAFKDELQVGKWYVYGRSLLNYQGLSRRGLIQAYGFLGDKSWMETSNCGNNFKEWKEATNDEVKEAFEKEIIKRFGKDWKNARIEECLYHGKPDTNSGTFIPALLTRRNLVWNRNGCIFKDGKWAEPLIEKTRITKEKALKIIAEKLNVLPENIIIE